jgi:hypothetical protein
MKTAILFFSVCLMTFSLKAQYSMNTTLTTYQDISNPISVNNGNIWNEGSSYPIYINFNFHISGQTYTALNVQAGGGINFPGIGTKELYIYHTPFGGYLLKDKGTTTTLSNISYENSGVIGQQILKIQWKNAGFIQWYSTSDTSDFVDFQVWLYESDNHIEIHFGSNSVDPGTYGYPEATSDSNPGTSIKFLFDTCNNMFGVTGPCNLPSYWFFDSCIPNYTFIDGTPSTGITYNIYPTNNVGLSENNSEQINIFPNPANDNLFISRLNNNSSIQSIEILDVLGNLCLILDNSLDNENIKAISIKGLTSGIYFLKLTNSDNQAIIKKLIINSH